jgi:hypothetical protein
VAAPLTQGVKRLGVFMPHTDRREIYQIKVTLRGSKPPIWRRLLLWSETPLDEVHDVLQIAMGWTDSHLHQFLASQRRYGVPDPEWGEDDLIDESDIPLRSILTRESGSILYEYDFGDGWEHTIELEKILHEDLDVPVCLEGRRACPPEDVGGLWGYSEFLEAISDRSHPEHEEYREWVDETFDAERFDLGEVNELLTEYYR